MSWMVGLWMDVVGCLKTRVPELATSILVEALWVVRLICWDDDGDFAGLEFDLR